MHLITYRLHKPGKDYEALYAAIKALSGTYWHNTTSSWLVESSLTPKQIYSRLSSSIDTSDELAVFKLSGAYYGQLQPDDNKWLAARATMYVA